MNVKNSFLEMIWQFIKSYAIIFCITVAEITVGLLIVGVRPEDNVILVKGSVPGPKNGLVLIRKQ